jgi:hypothetical protein
MPGRPRRSRGASTLIKKTLRALLAVLILYSAWLAYEELSFKPHSGRASSPEARDPLEIEGVYHIHTTHSDGRSTVDELARDAAREGIDFLVITDHGNPNKESLRDQGLKEGVLVLAGSELSENRGHLVALAFRTPEGTFSQKAEEAVPEIQAQGGFAVIAHPYSKVRWLWGDSSVYSGLEIINADTMFKNNIRRVLPYLPLLLVNSRIPLIRMLEHPEINLRKWDQRNATAPIFGYFSADAHLYYRPVFSLLRLHVLLDRPLSRDFGDAAGQVYGALRDGRFFNAVEAVADARGFRFRAFDGSRPVAMGDTIRPAGPGIRFEVEAPFAFAKEIRLIRDGRPIAATGGDVLSAEAEGPGVYRVEVFLRARSPLGKDIPWIVSNPIFLRKD